MIFKLLNLHPLSISWMLILTLQTCYSLRFNLQPHSKKCLKQEMYADQLAMGEYEVSNIDAQGTTVDMTIKDSVGHIAYTRDNIEGKGKFAVTSDSADIYELCFTYTAIPNNDVQLPAREIYIDYRVGAEAKQYDAIDTADKLSDLEKDLNKIESLTNSMIIDFAHLKKREKEMRDTNASTNTRLFYQTVTSVIILMVLTAWQVLYLRTFFKARKLID